MTTTSVGFRHRLKRRHLEPEADYLPENKRYLSEKIAQEMGVLKLDDHNAGGMPIVGIGSPQSPCSPCSPYSTSPPSTLTPPPSPFHTPSCQPSSPFSFAQRINPQTFHQQLQQLHQIQHPVHQYQLQQQLQQHHIAQQRQLLQPSSPPLTPITYEHPKADTEGKALTLYQPFQFSVTDPQGERDEDVDDVDDVEDVEEEEEEGKEKLTRYTVNIPFSTSKLDFLPPLPQEDLSKALILYSSPTEVIQNSLNKKLHKANTEEIKLPPIYEVDEMEDLEEGPYASTTAATPFPSSPFPPSPSVFYPSPASSFLPSPAASSFLPSPAASSFLPSPTANSFLPPSFNAPYSLQPLSTFDATAPPTTPPNGDSMMD